MNEFKKVINDNVFNVLPKFDDNKFHTIISDTPYNLSTEWFISKDGAFQVKGKAKDFMNKWDGLTGENLDEMFYQFNRVLKHGGYCLLFGMDNQIAPFQYYAIKNGFEVCQSLYWYYINNLPKASDVSKVLMKKDNTELIPVYDGYKYGKRPLKQVVETIMCFKKPNKYNSLIEDIIKSQIDLDISPSVINLKDNRVGFENQNSDKEGRYPPNVFIDSNASENIDSMSGILKSGKDKNPTKNSVSGFFGGTMGYYSSNANYGDSGGASRVLHKCDYEEQDSLDLFIYSSKTSPQEKNAGLSEGEGNIHPTQKPIKLIEHIIKLFKLPKQCNQQILIPFSGVCSEVLGCIKAGINIENIIAIEINEQYCEIGKERINYWTSKWIEDGVTQKHDK